MGLGGGCVIDGGDCGYGKWVADFDGDDCGGGFLLRFVGLWVWLLILPWVQANEEREMG